MIEDEYKTMFKDYADVVGIKTMRKMLGGISSTLAYRLVKQGKIKSIKIGREYKIPKINIILYILDKEK